MSSRASKCPNCALPARYQRSSLVCFFGKNLILLAGVFWIVSAFFDVVSEFGGTFAPMTAHARQTEKSYTIIKDESVQGVKRSVDVLLEHEIPENQLKQIARRIMSTKGPPPDRTFISYYVSWQTGSSNAWATTHFDPDLDVRIIGTDEKQNQLDTIPDQKTAVPVTDVAQTNP